MPSERPRGFIVDRAFDERLKFPPNWEGELPPPDTREELREKLLPGFDQSNLTDEEVEQVLDFFELYVARYHSDENGGGEFHRDCGGGACELGHSGQVACANCGALTDIPMPACMRRWAALDT